MAKQVSKTQEVLSSGFLSDDEIKQLLDAGLTEIQVANFIKKGTTFDKILKKLGTKVAENEARAWLKARFGKEMKIPERKLPPLTKQQLKEGWKAQNPNQSMKLKFPLLPSVNHMYQTNPRTGSKQMTLPAQKLFAELQDYIDEQIIKQDWEPTYKTFLVADLWFYFPDYTRRDSHNMQKIMLDCMDGIAFDDDYWLMPRTQRIIIDKDTEPRIEIKLYLFKEPQPIFIPKVKPYDGHIKQITGF